MIAFKITQGNGWSIFIRFREIHIRADCVLVRKLFEIDIQIHSSVLKLGLFQISFDNFRKIDNCDIDLPMIHAF